MSQDGGNRDGIEQSLAFLLKEDTKKSILPAFGGAAAAGADAGGGGCAAAAAAGPCRVVLLLLLPKSTNSRCHFASIASAF